MIKIKKYIFQMIEPAAHEKITNKIFDLIIMGLIFFSVVSVFIMTFPVDKNISDTLTIIEKYTMAVFTVEYILRVWTADYLYPASGKVKSRFKYILSGMAIIDLIAILPFFLPMFLPVNLVGIRAFRLLRLLRIFKLNRYSDALSSICEVVREKFREIVASIIFVFILLIIVSLLIYYAEHDAQPEKFSNAFSGLWWAVATLTTVGYGDIYPITVLGRILGAVIAILGIGMVAVPTGILSAGFVEVLEKKKLSKKEQSSADEKKQYCPYCGNKL